MVKKCKLLENKGERQTVFLSSHRLNEVERLADRVGIMDKGKLLAVKSLEEVKSRKKGPGSFPKGAAGKPGDFSWRG